MILLIDIILIIALLSIIASSSQAGFIKTLGGLIGIIVGVIVAGQYFERLADWLMPIFRNAENLSKVAAFIVIFAAVNLIISALVWILDSSFHFISFIPFLKTINKMGGAILGFLVGVLILGV
ncbi:CvpA family protein, partial [Patescibacteria group bacterium]|nr:CvpA family protein [Patescibacteria group bacterium]